jgi:polyhydroxybutyrate depolymerase
VGGLRRTYLVRTAGPAAPVLLAFHGYSSSALTLVATTGLAAAGPAAGFTTVFPQGSGSPARWAIPGHLRGPDDVAFVDAVLTDLATQGCGDPSRTFAAGFSNGAAFTGYLACRRPARLEGVALIGGAGLAPACAAARLPASAPVVLIHGAADATVRFSGGPVLGGALVAEPFDRSVARWRASKGRTVVDHTLPAWGHTWPSVATERIVTTFAM